MYLKATWPEAVYAKHQVEGIEWMLGLEKEGMKVTSSIHGEYSVHGGILGDEMGLGKTIQSLALIVNGKGTNTLIVSPLAVKKQWIEAASKARLNIFTAEKHGWIRVGKRVLGAKSVYISHYEKVVSATSLFKQSFDRIILDEAHRIRNTKTSTGKAVLNINATYKWALTATPIVNSLDDAVAYLKFIGFKIDSNKWSDRYTEWIHHVYLARTMDEGEAPAGLTMPPTPITEVKFLDFTNKEEETVYTGILNNIESQWRSAQALKGVAYELQRFAILLRLRQVSVNPQIYINARKREAFGWTGPEFLVPSRKFDEISHLLRDSYENGESNRWIIFCQFREEIELLSSFLKAFPFIGSVLQYHGGLSQAERNDAIKESKIHSTNAKQDVFLIQLQAGGTGLNLQNYNRIIFISPWWTSALLEQARGRAVRIGQKDVVKIYWLRLSAEEDRMSIDTLMMDKADAKRDIALEFLGWSRNKKNN